MKTGHVVPHISESYNPLWNLERSTGHVPHAIANIYYPEISGYFKESKPSSESVPIQEPTLLVCKEGPRLRTFPDNESLSN
jgi:hypothetical protein